MATLIRNVWADGRYWGPDHGNADLLPAHLHDQVPRDAWYPAPPAEQWPGVPDYETAARAAQAAQKAAVAELDGMSRDELVAFAREHGIKVHPRGRVADLRRIIREAL